MYKLYYLPSACSPATQVLKHKLELPVEILNISKDKNFANSNPVGSVPVVVDGANVYVEGLDVGTQTDEFGVFFIESNSFIFPYFFISLLSLSLFPIGTSPSKKFGNCINSLYKDV